MPADKIRCWRAFLNTALAGGIEVKKNFKHARPQFIFKLYSVKQKMAIRVIQ